MKGAIDTMDKMPKEKPNADFRFPKDAKPQPSGFKSLAADDEVTVTIKGRVSSFSDNASQWDQGKRFSVEISSCEVETKQKGVSLDDALEAAKTVQ